MGIIAIKEMAHLGDDNFEILVSTDHGDSIAHTAVHSIVEGRSIGGCRFVNRAELSELGNLAKVMSSKCSDAQIPAGGQKTLVICKGDCLPSEERRAQILTDHILAVMTAYSGGIYGPDMNAPESVMDRVAGVPRLARLITGLSKSAGGLAIDRNGYTAIGVSEAVECWAESNTVLLREISAAIQGFGAVGAHTSRLLHARDIRIVAVSNRLGTIRASDMSSLPASRLFGAWKKGGDSGVIQLASEMSGAVVDADPLELMEISCDVFIPAARTNVLASITEIENVRQENPEVLPIERFLASRGVRAIVEAANHPLSDEARRIARQQEVTVLEDTRVNCGGLIGCWMEWRNRALANPVSLEQLAIRAKQRIRTTVRANVLKDLTGLEGRSSLLGVAVRSSSPEKRSRKQRTASHRQVVCSVRRQTTPPDGSNEHVHR